MLIPEDIIAKVRKDFSGDDMMPILQLLSEFQKEGSEYCGDRILRCIVFMAHGNFEKFARAVTLARNDCRDLIVEAEYDGRFGEEFRRRNMNLPFTD